MVIGATELAVPEVSNRTAKSVSVYVLDPVSYPPFDGRIGPQFSPYDRPVEYANYVNQFVSHPEEYFQRNTQPDAVASQIQSRRPQSGSSSSASAPPFTFGNLPSLPSFTRLFPVSGTKCTTGSGDAGVCLSQSECDNQGGVKDGNCGTILFNSAGVCCSFSVRKCSDTAVRSPMTWVTPPRSSNKISCTLTFPANPGLSVAGTTIGGGLTATSDSIRSCQLRVDFLSFRLSPPNPISTVCEDDYFSVTGSLTPAPKLCGDSYNDQHMYLTFNEEQDDITLGFFLNDASNKDWKLKITRIPCSAAEDLAPANCLQYMTKSAGQIESFNFKQDYPAAVRQLADQNYNICFKRRTGYCSVCLSPCPMSKKVPGFLLTKKASQEITGGATGKSCDDQLIIPGGISSGNIRESVYCGAALNPTDGATNDAQICTTSDRITYITDDKENAETEENNAGFCLSYSQKKC